MLVMVTQPVAPVLNDTGVVDIPSVVGVTGAVTVTGTVVASVLLPPKLMAVGPSAAAAVRVMSQLAREASAAPHVFDCTVIPLPAGAVAITLKAAEAPVLLMRTVVEPPAANDSGALGIESVAVGTGTVTVICTVVVGVLLPPKLTAVGPSAAAAVSVIVQLAAGARIAAQVVLDTAMPLPAGMVACTLNAGALPLLLMVTEPAPPVPKDTGAVGMFSVVGVTGVVTVTGTVVAGVLLPPTPMFVGPSGPAAVSVMVQLAPTGSDAGQVEEATVMPLPTGMMARRLNAGAVPLLVMVTEPAP